MFFGKTFYLIVIIMLEPLVYYNYIGYYLVNMIYV